jgi:hypothetical protein
MLALEARLHFLLSVVAELQELHSLQAILVAAAHQQETCKTHCQHTTSLVVWHVWCEAGRWVPRFFACVRQLLKM